MDKQALIEILKQDYQGLLNVEGVKYGVYYKGSYWTGGSPAQSIISLLKAYPKYRVTKDLSVIELDSNLQARTGLIGPKPFAQPIIFNAKEVRYLREKSRTNQ